MNNNIILTAETGSDITPELAAEYGIQLVPMHVSLGNVTLDDGSFPCEDVCDYYDRTGKVPQTSAAAPGDFERVFDEIHDNWPDKHILHLAYSAVTTCSYQNAGIASENRDYVTRVDTKHVSVGQAVAVIETAHYLEAHPDCTVEEAAQAAADIAERVQMSFITKNLDYLRAGGRVSNAVALVGNLLNLHPCIEIINGELIAKKKYRGSVRNLIPKVIRDFTEKHDADRGHLYFIWSPGLDDASKKNAEQEAKKLGYASCTWMKTGCVITCHSGPGAFGVVGMKK